MMYFIIGYVLVTMITSYYITKFLEKKRIFLGDLLPFVVVLLTLPGILVAVGVYKYLNKNK